MRECPNVPYIYSISYLILIVIDRNLKAQMEVASPRATLEIHFGRNSTVTTNCDRITLKRWRRRKKHKIVATTASQDFRFKVRFTFTFLCRRSNKTLGTAEPHVCFKFKYDARHYPLENA